MDVWPVKVAWVFVSWVIEVPRCGPCTCTLSSKIEDKCGHDLVVVGTNSYVNVVEFLIENNVAEVPVCQCYAAVCRHNAPPRRPLSC